MRSVDVAAPERALRRVGRRSRAALRRDRSVDLGGAGGRPIRPRNQLPRVGSRPARPPGATDVPVVALVRLRPEASRIGPVVVASTLVIAAAVGAAPLPPPLVPPTTPTFTSRATFAAPPRGPILATGDGGLGDAAGHQSQAPGTRRAVLESLDAQAAGTVCTATTPGAADASDGEAADGHSKRQVATLDALDGPRRHRPPTLKAFAGLRLRVHYDIVASPNPSPPPTEPSSSYPSSTFEPERSACSAQWPSLPKSPRASASIRHRRCR